MKAIYHIMASLMALAAMVACTEMEIRNESQDAADNGLIQELCITGRDFQFDVVTRSSVTIGESGASFTWDEDDVIGIFPDKGDQVSFAMDEGAGTQTATFSGGGWALKSSSTYAAYYPHVYENRDMTAIPVSYVGQTQNGNGNTDHIGAYDFMAAGVSTPENGSVAFDMQHLGALVQLTITVPEPSTLTKVVLTSSTEFTETGIIDLTAAMPAITAVTQSNTLEVALNDVITTEANENVTVYFMVAPVDLSESELTATVHTTCEMKITGKNFQAGKAYRLFAEAKMLNNYIDEYGVNHGNGTEIDGVVWAPVNCGYHKDDFKYGKLYQWGRKYGQGYSGTLYDINGETVGEYSDASIPISVHGPTGMSNGQKEENKDNFFCSFNSTRDWCVPATPSLWNSGTESNPVKTAYDPCPVGWRVPTKTELLNLSLNYSSWTLEAEKTGYWFSGSQSYTSAVPCLFFPSAGVLWVNEYGLCFYRGFYGDYWSSAADGNESYNLHFHSKYVNVMNSCRAQACSIRCVLE